MRFRAIWLAAFMLWTATVAFACSPTGPQPEYLTGTWLVYPSYHVVFSLNEDCTYEATTITDAPSLPVVMGELELEGRIGDFDGSPSLCTERAIWCCGSVPVCFRA
ncbi:MAG: hypothetical protein OXQ29_24590 [Rhodospirillaceae bacterium]|nr:hypothetical protein [Rhodospirillaceae bacterium]